MSQRDTQFAGFANALIKRLVGEPLPDAYRSAEETHLLVARAAYDLVEHTLGIVPHLLQVVGDAKDLDVVMPYVPDLPTLPEEK